MNDWLIETAQALLSKLKGRPDAEIVITYTAITDTPGKRVVDIHIEYPI